MLRTVTIAASLVVIGLPLPYSVGQIRSGSKLENTRPERLLIVAPNSPVEVRRLLDGRESLIDGCLQTIARPQPTTYQQRAEKLEALRLLGQLRAGDRRDAVEALVQNLAFRFPTPHTDSPLWGFKAAQSLADIGSSAMPRLLDHLRNELSQGELRLVAFVIHKVDGRLLGRARIQIEIDRLAAAPDGAASVKTYVRNLDRLRAWFSDPQFFTDSKNCPASGEF